MFRVFFVRKEAISITITLLLSFYNGVNDEDEILFLQPTQSTEPTQYIS